MLNNLKVRNDFSADEMLLNDAFEDGRVALGVPDAFGVNDGDRTLLANSQTVGFTAKNTA